MRLSRVIVIGASVLLTGCQTGTLPNPHEPRPSVSKSPDILRDELKSVSEMLFAHEVKREISDDQYHDYVAKAASELLVEFNPNSIDAQSAWKYGEVLIAARKWKEAKEVEQVAVETAKAAHNEDRRVNDTLRLALVETESGEIDEAIKQARTLFNAPPQAEAPVLYGALDIIKAADGKGHLLELAQFLEDAIAVDVRVIVDPQSLAGRKFIETRPHYRSMAWNLVVSLYQQANRSDLAQKAQLQAEAMLHDFAQDFSQKV